MAFSTRPTPDLFANVGWSDVAPWFDELANRPLDLGSVDGWMADWTALEEALEEAAVLAQVAYAADTADPAKEAAQLRFFGEIVPRRDQEYVRLAGRVLDLGYTRPDIEIALQRLRNQRDIFRAESIPLREEIEELNSRYARLTGEMTVIWDGDEVPLPRLIPYTHELDRATRERAYRLSFAPFIAVRGELAALFDRQYALRQQIARNAGFANYRDFAFREFNRFAYSPEDCERFHAAIERRVVPALARRRERARQHLGLSTLRPWDTNVDPLGRPPLRPYATADELIGGTIAAITRLDETLGGYLATLAREGLLDLDSRPGKQPVGFCAYLPFRRRTFIFMNGVGTQADVETLLHEAGHAAHGVEVANLPLFFQRDPGAEMNEVASMTLELLVAPYLGRADGAFYDEADLDRARSQHLERILVLLCQIAQGDAFQYWIYTSGQGDDPSARDAAWLAVTERFNAGIDWTGLEAERIAGWYEIPHFFLYPLYVIEYAIAQVVALQIWRKSRRDQPAAVAAYRRALTLGGTRPLPDLVAAAGARLAFDEATLAELVGEIEEELARLDP